MDEDRYRILHIDDSQDFLEQFQACYSPWFDIISLEKSAQALETLTHTKADGIILDYDMPEMDGLSFLEILTHKHPSIPVIFYTGLGSEEIVRQAFLMGASDYFVKDISLFVHKEKLVNSVRNAIKRTKLEEDLRKKQEMLENIIEMNPYSISIFDSKGYFFRGNKAYLDLFKLPPPKDYNMFNDPIFSNSTLKDSFLKGIKGKAIRFPPIWYNIHEIDPTAPDNPICISLSCFSIKNSKEEIEYYIGMYEDITARITAEEELKKTQDELENRIKERTVLLQQEIEEKEKLRQKLESQNQELASFAYRVSHDLKNNVTLLKRLSELHMSEPETFDKNLRLFTNTADNLIKFTNNLLNLAVAGRVIDKPENINLRYLIHKAFYLEKTRHKDAALVTEENLPVIKGDVHGFNQVISNLINNSFKYRDSEKPILTISVNTEQDEKTLRIYYSDNGMGIESDNLSRIFDPSFTTDKTSGFGLGLSIVKKIIEAHGGNIEVKSGGRNNGTDFIISLPLDHDNLN
jgi:signal transduction histidine kinase/FixJ family two-component response regulator